MNDVGNASLDVINGGGCWHWDLAGELGNSVSDSLSPGVIGPDCVALVGVHGQAKVPPINAMGCSTAMYAEFYMDDDACARRSNGHAIDIKGSVELCPGR